MGTLLQSPLSIRLYGVDHSMLWAEETRDASE
jgi:hypothetical protein